MKKKILYVIATIIIALASFVYGRYNIIWGNDVNPDGSVSSISTPHFESWSEMAIEARQRSNILMDIVEDVHIDSPGYFEHIKLCSSYKQLQTHFYEWVGDGPWDWDNMYNY